MKTIPAMRRLDSRHLAPFGLGVAVLVLLAWPGSALAVDCNLNGLDDLCDLDCGAMAGACNVAGCGLGADCDSNGRLDECDLTEGGAGCYFPTLLLDNSTTGADSIFLGPPDGTYYGLGGQIVTYELDCGFIYDGAGPDFTIYEYSGGSPEFDDVDVLVSADGANFFSVKVSESLAINVPGDSGHGNNNNARSYDLVPSGLGAVRFVRLDGVGTGGSGSGTAFDLDAMGVVNRIGRDCDSSGTLDVCEAHTDCNANTIPESCEFALGAVQDCDGSLTPDTCDTLGGINDCDGDSVPDSCEPDCNTNTVPDDCDIAAMTSGDCNANGVPDDCDLALTVVSESSGTLPLIGYNSPESLTIVAPFPSAGDVTVSMTALADLGASGEYVDVDVNAFGLGRLFDAAGEQCIETTEALIVPAETFNIAVAGVDAVFNFTTSSGVNVLDCGGSYSSISVDYVPIVDCNSNGTLDSCDIAGAVSTDVNLNGIADDCETDCNGNNLPDDYDIAQATSQDCNLNGVPDECDLAGSSLDCNTNQIPDECETDCNTNGVPDDCDIASATSTDCDLNAVPDECDLAAGAGGCPFPRLLLDNSTNEPDSTFVGPPDTIWQGIGGQIVTWDYDCGFIVDGPGPDFTIYEYTSGSPEFDSLDDIQVSVDGVSFFSVAASETAVVRVPGDGAHTNDNNARSYDLDVVPMLNAVRYVRVDGVGTGASGLFDLDAMGAVNRLGVDCDSSGVLDVCETFSDCNGNGLRDSCEMAAGIDADCNGNATLDACDIVGGDPDVDSDGTPDSCEPDCNTNAVPDDFDISQGTSTDCNDNTVPDECDISTGTSLDCNTDLLPDECPVCPTVEVVFIVDTSSSMSGEGAALCASITQIVADLQADLVNVNAEILGVDAPGTGSFSCLTDSVANLYGVNVPGSPPPGTEIMGDCGGANDPEDWGPATSVVAGLKAWQADSVRLIVPVSDEGPRCGNPVSDPGVDRDSINHAIGQAQLNDVIVSPITGSGSSGDVINMATILANNTGGSVFASVDPAQDLSDGIQSVIIGACNARGDCNANGVPDECDLSAGTSQDCDASNRPDECEEDCNANGLHDSCDIAAMTSDDDNANMVPDECEGLTLTLDRTDLLWTSLPGAIGYDVVQGDLTDLRSFTGDFGLATDACTVNNHAGTTQPHGADPTAGNGYWYLVRAVLGTGQLGYDTFAPGQVAPRDAGITASGLDCP